jgi:hypothetical protein
MNDSGMSTLIKNLEEATGIKARCNATVGMASHRLAQQNITKHGELTGDYIKWMDRFVDWEVESQIGYSRRGGGDTLQKKMPEARQDDPTPTAVIEPPTLAKPVGKIILLGERHSGTSLFFIVTTTLKSTPKWPGYS